MRITPIILFALASPLLSTMRVTTSRGYVRTERMLDAGATTKATSVQYFDRLKKVTDSYTTRLNYYGASDFVDGANQTTEYEYYGN